MHGRVKSGVVEIVRDKSWRRGDASAGVEATAYADFMSATLCFDCEDWPGKDRDFFLNVNSPNDT